MDEENIKKRTNKTKKWSKKHKVIFSSVSVFVLLIALVLTGYFYVRSKVYTEYTPSDLKNETEYTEVEGITNVLLIGTDARTLDEQSRSDSIIIATLDNNNKKVKLTSIFRDTLVDIPGYGESKINAAYALGGPELLLETIRNTFKIDIDKYVVINFWGFEAVIDKIGGIEVDIKDYQLEELNKYIGESTSGNDCPVTETGLQLLNGKQALSYARIRKGVGDEFERTSRQQEVIMKVAEKMKETKPSKYLGIMNSMLEHIRTNIPPLQALNMAYTIYKFPALEIEQLQVPIPELSEGRLYKDLGWVFLTDIKQNTELLNDFIFENKVPNPDDFDYYSLYEVLAQYAAKEDVYNRLNNIKPEDYKEKDKEEKPQVQPEKPPVEPEKPPVEPEKPPVEEQTAPTINGATDKQIFVGDSFNPLAGVTASDKEDGDLTSKIIVNGAVDTTKPGAYSVTYTITDSKGASISQTITVTVVPKNPPENPSDNPPPAQVTPGTNTNN